MEQTGELRRHTPRRSLAALLIAEVISVTGSQMTKLALPWFVLVTTRSPARMGIVLATEMLAMALFGIPGGDLAARLGARRTMLVSDLLRGVLIATIPLLYAIGALSFPLLLLIVFLIGAPFTPYQTAQVVILPDLVGADERLLARANALLLGANRTTVLLGAPLAGVLISLVGTRAVLWLDAATFLAAFLLIARLVPVGKAVPQTTDARGLLAGLRTLWRDLLLRTWTITISGFEMAWQILFAAIPVLAFVRYGGDPRIAGVLFAMFGGGALAGNLLVLPLLRNVTPLRLVVLGKIPQSLAFWILLLDLRAVTVGVVLAITGACTGLIGGPATAVMTNRIPLELRAKAMAAFLTITLVAGSLGLLAGAPVLEAFGVRVSFLIVALAHTVGGFFFAAAALRASAQPDALKASEEA